MKRLVLIAALALVSTGALGVEREIPLSYDDAWQKAVRVITLEGFDLSAIDKDSGTIQGIKSLDLDPLYLVCPILKGRATSYSYRIAVAIQKKDESSSTVSIQGKGVRESYQNDHQMIFWKSRIDTETNCESTGELENSLLNKIFNP